MKCMIPEISWHNREPVLCVDIQPVENDFYRLATGGSDYHILIWHGKITENGAVTVDVVSDLTRHQRAVNVVRWSPNGQYLASADDDANIIIWNLKIDNIPLLEGDTSDKETWVITKIMRGHKEDIYDLCWSPNSLKILSGSIDNTAIIWDFGKGKMDIILSDHKGFVQGVCWDPKGEYIATLSSDRFCRVYEGNGKQVRARISRGTLPVPESHPLYKKEVKYFHDDTFKSYFRRITFTPDGSLIVAPAGCIETDDSKKALTGSYLFTLDCLTQPVALLPLQRQCSIAAKCCPILYELRPDGADPVINLPYRMIIAIATESDVILYDTQQLVPFAHLQKIHYTRLTDLTWSIDGRLLMACSTDGFCTVLTFEPEELGIPYTKTKQESEVEESFMDVSGCEELEKDIVEIKNKDDKPKRESFLLQWANKIKEDNGKVSDSKVTECEISEECKVNKQDCKSNSKNGILNKIEIVTQKDQKENLISSANLESVETIEITDSPEKTKEPIKKGTPRRIIPIKLNSPGNKEKKKNSPVTSTTAKRKGKQLDGPHMKETKPNPLMNFLKVTTPDGNKTDTSTATVTISEESSNARDAWNKDAKVTAESVYAEDSDMLEHTADFNLQLEESTTQTTKPVNNCNESVLLEDNKDVEMIDKTNKLKESTDSKNKNIQASATSEKSPSIIKQIEIKKNTEVDIKKTPRRIQLITLSSPKHKKQKK